MPIGSLTSQYFANYYLDCFDRFLLETLKVKAYVRYMDDIIFWDDDKRRVKDCLQAIKEYLDKERKLVLNSNIQINRSIKGVTFCGFRIFPGTLKLSKRRKQRYIARKNYWEKMYINGLIDEKKLQCAYDSVHAITANADSIGWRKKFFCDLPEIDV